MEWSALDIRKASVLKKQIDLALLTLKQSILEGNVVSAASDATSFVLFIIIKFLIIFFFLFILIGS
jgi:hypothetical protein